MSLRTSVLSATEAIPTYEEIAYPFGYDVARCARSDSCFLITGGRAAFFPAPIPLKYAGLMQDGVRTETLMPSRSLRP